MYKGEYKKGKKDGYGIYVWPDGRRYEGYWKDGCQNGEGTAMFNAGEVTYQSGNKEKAVWIMGKPVVISKS